MHKRAGLSFTECTAVGTVASAALPDLLELLTGLAGSPGEPVNRRENVLEKPGAGSAPRTELRLVQDSTPSNATRGDRRAIAPSICCCTLLLRLVKYAQIGPIVLLRLLRPMILLP